MVHCSQCMHVWLPHFLILLHCCIYAVWGPCHNVSKDSTILHLGRSVALLEDA